MASLFPSCLLLLVLLFLGVSAQEEVDLGIDGVVISADTKGVSAAILEKSPVEKSPVEPSPLEPMDLSVCEDQDDLCADFFNQGECHLNPQYMYRFCRRACDLCDKGNDIEALIFDAIVRRDGATEDQPKAQEMSHTNTEGPQPTPVEKHPDCQDDHHQCAQWATDGECEAVTGNPEYMYRNCPRSCNICGRGDVEAILRQALRLRSSDLSVSGWGEEQQIPPANKKEIETLLADVEKYMLEVVNAEEKYKSFKKKCQNRHQDCSLWAIMGECDKNPKYMTTHCAPSCKTCEMVDFHYRCPMPENIPEVDAWKPGDVNKMFERIVADFPKVNIFSRPSDDRAEDGPWVITIDNFLTDEECERLIELGHVKGYERSADVGKMNWDGTFEDSINDGRTSTNAWCEEDCQSDAKTKSVLEKIENLTGIPEQCSESLQLLRYEPGQFYQTHHDYIDEQLDRPEGVRILTVFLYLNEPESGGGTNFPTLLNKGPGGLTVMPKKGRVLLWPSVLNEDPNTADLRTEHQALTVEAGLKFGANAWVHQRDFKTPQETGCT